LIKRLLYTLLVCSCFSLVSSAQEDSTTRLTTPDSLIQQAPVISDQRKIDSIRKAFVPKKATLRSLILPGWGQAYNKKYWKIPIIYGALGITTGVFVYNIKNYKALRFAYTAQYEAGLPPRATAPPDYPGPFRDSTKYRQADPRFIQFDLNTIKVYRDEFRRNIDYTVLFFLLFWGLNVADATVDAHLKAFDVSPDLSFRFKLGPSQMAGTTGLSLVVGVKNKADYKPRLLSVR
jgi:hypothetical protein